MEPVNIVLWKWKDPKWPSSYTAEHVNITADAITRNLRIPHRIFCVTDDAHGIDERVGIVPLWPDFADMGKCYRRLRLFARDMEQIFGSRIISVDLDTVFTGDLTPLFTRSEDFLIARDTQPGTPYNGSFFSMRAGARHRVFAEFAERPLYVRSRGKELGYCACDQAAMAVILGTNEATVGADAGLYSYKNEIQRLHNDRLPENARMVFFHGDPKPSACLHLPWVKNNYRRSRRALLVIGGASCVWDDLKAVDIAQYDVCAVNDIGSKLECRIDYWATLHPEKIAGWRAERKGNTDYAVWSHTKYPLGDVHNVLTKYWRSSKGVSGSSGLFGAQVGIELGYDYVLLAGIPMQPTAHYFDDKAWDACEPFKLAWTEHLNDLKGRVFSLSGWSRELLGYTPFVP